MAYCQLLPGTSRTKQLCKIKERSKSAKGSFTRYFLNMSTVFSEEWLRREKFGEKNPAKPHKTILLVGETGAGKSTLINAIVNYVLGVQCKDRMWCEIIETKEDQTDSQTMAVTVYDVFAEDSPLSLTIIDTPGYGSTTGTEDDLKVTETLHKLFGMSSGVQKMDAVGLVVSSKTNRLTERQIYIFDAVLSLFSKDVEKNIVVLITNVTNRPTNTIQAVIKSKIKCAKTSDGKPVYFCFDNSHCEAFNSEYEDELETEDEVQKYEETWSKNEKNMNNLFAFMKDTKTLDLALTESVLRRRKQLTASISNLKDRIILKELKTNELKQTKTNLQEHEKTRDKDNFEYEVNEVYKKKVPIESEWWHWTTEATCCRVCEENCHYPGCWLVRDLLWCSVMKDGKCTVCTGKCGYTQHVKEGKIYETKTRNVKRTYEELRKKYETKSGDIKGLVNRLEEEIKEIENEKIRLVEECYHCVLVLEEMALKTSAVSTLQHLDFLIEKVKEMGLREREQKLEELKKRGEEENKGMLGRMMKYFYS